MVTKASPTAVSANSGAEEAGLADPGDSQLLGKFATGHEATLLTRAAKLGYKQELRRQYSTVQIFAVAFSIMGLVPSIASTLAFSLPAGPAGMVWVLYSCLIIRQC